MGTFNYDDQLADEDAVNTEKNLTESKKAEREYKENLTEEFE